MTGTSDHPGDDARQRAFHAGDDDDDAGGGEAIAFAQHAVNAGDADVVEPLDAVAHHLGGDRGFFRHRKIGRAGGGDDDRAPCPVTVGPLHA